LSNGETPEFCQTLGKSSSKKFQMIKQAYSEEALGCSAVFKWHKRSAQGRDSLEEEEDTGWKRTKIQEVATLLHANHSQMNDKS
jgi:hypothetical protein